MRRRVWGTTVSAVVWLTAVTAAWGQPCSDVNDCTANDACADGECHGIPMLGASCELSSERLINGTSATAECSDGNECTIDDACVGAACRGSPNLGASCGLEIEDFVDGRCEASGSATVCQGDPAPVGAPCGRGCGTLQELEPGSPVHICFGEPQIFGQPCPNLGPFESPCTTGECVHNGPEVDCRIEIKQCPDDGDPCTREACSNATGECETYSACTLECEMCEPSTGACTPTNEGGPCDDGNPCTTESHCESRDIPGYRIVGECKAGPTTEPSATPIPISPTPTLAPCVGDCDRNGSVRVDELIVGVSIALQRAALAACASFDEDDSGQVEVHELIGGVNNLLLGCRSA